MSNNHPHGLKLVSIPLHQVIFMSKICNINPHGLKLVSISNNITPNNILTKYTIIIYLVWSWYHHNETKLFPCPKYPIFIHTVWNWYRYIGTKLFSYTKYAVSIHMVWNWYRYVDTKLVSWRKHAIFIHLVWKLVSISLHQIIFTCKICNNYPHDLTLVSISLHQIIFNVQNIQYLPTSTETGINTLYIDTKLCSCPKYAIIIHMVWSWYRYLYTKLFLMSKISNIYPHRLKLVSIHCISTPNYVHVQNI